MNIRERNDAGSGVSLPFVLELLEFSKKAATNSVDRESMERMYQHLECLESVGYFLQYEEVIVRLRDLLSVVKVNESRPELILKRGEL